MPFKDIKGITFYSLQFGKPEDLAYAKENNFNLIDLTANIKNFDESAAVIQQLDLLITVDTSSSHLAGALGVPVWILVDNNADWRWLVHRTDSPWYPSVKLYRQTKYKNWNDVIEKVYQDLVDFSQMTSSPS